MAAESNNSEAEAKWALRVKSKKSQNAVLRDLSPKDTVKELLGKLANLTGVPEDQMAILTGFPPKRISYDTGKLVESLGLQHQDTIIVEVDTTGTPNKGDEPTPGTSGASMPSTSSQSKKTYEADSVSEPPLINLDDEPEPSDQPGTSSYSYGDLIPSTEDHSGLLLRQIVPSDNSCLFTSVTYCLSGQLQTQTDSEGGSNFLREMIANTVDSDSVKYNEALLGRPNKEYVNWIKKPESWGGGIELSILAEFYGMQISVVDTQSLHISCFGEDQNYANRIFLIYDGIHYDPLYYESFSGGANRTIFEVTDQKMMDLAMQLAREAKASNQFTDVKNFSLRCRNCNTLLKGQKEAQEHAKKTGHTDFSEITNP